MAERENAARNQATEALLTSNARWLDQFFAAAKAGAWKSFPVGYAIQESR
jgi:hypothetical protein